MRIHTLLFCAISAFGCTKIPALDDLLMETTIMVSADAAGTLSAEAPNATDDSDPVTYLGCRWMNAGSYACTIHWSEPATATRAGTLAFDVSGMGGSACEAQLRGNPQAYRIVSVTSYGIALRLPRAQRQPDGTCRFVMSTHDTP